jgi:hypothetical protein
MRAEGWRCLVWEFSRRAVKEASRLRSPLFKTMKSHSHRCLCGSEWVCDIDIVNPSRGERALCREWPDSTCPSCLENLFANSNRATLESFAATMANYEPLSAQRAREVAEGRLI